MRIIFAEDTSRDHLLPLVFTRPVCELRTGILTLREKWELLLRPDQPSGFITEQYLQEKYPRNYTANEKIIFINAAVLPDDELVKTIAELKEGTQLLKDKQLLAARITADQLTAGHKNFLAGDVQVSEYRNDVKRIARVYDLFMLNDHCLRYDFRLLTEGKKSAAISSSNQVRNAAAIFIEEGAKVENSILNAETGPVYIAAGAEVMEGCMIRGPFALGTQAVLKMGTKIYGATTIGPGCKAGGEISNSVMLANSNKAHDGFLGNSVIGEWCNLGADTNNSNLKNNYGEVSIWNYALNDYEKTGLQFCGLFMGDHSKAAINTSFNTGTVTGVGANIFVHGFPPKFIPSFSWGGDEESTRYDLDKFLELADTVMKRRNLNLTGAERNLLSHLYLLELHPKAED